MGHLADVGVSSNVRFAPKPVAPSGRRWAAGSNGKGALLTGDILQVTADRKYLALMRSYPNFIPLSGPTVQKIADRIAPWQFDIIYGLSGISSLQKGPNRLSLDPSIGTFIGSRRTWPADIRRSNRGYANLIEMVQ
jgi:hypothetical protein